MRSSTRVLGGLAAAGLVAAGGSAYTASNTMTAVAADHVGYGSVSVTGVTVSNIGYNVSSTDSSMLSTIVFTVAEDVSGPEYKAILTINGSTTSQITCDPRTATTISCPTASQSVAGLQSVQLAVTAV